MAARQRVLAIDGGGIRGIIPAIVLAEIEKRTGERIAHLFELIAGTSTGGLIALGLTRPDDEGRPALSADELVGLYEREGPRIFSRTLWKRLRSLNGSIDERYSSEALTQALDKYLGDGRLKDAITEVIVTAYETEERFPFFFRSSRARNDRDYDFSIKEAALATSAAPTYFEPVQVRSDREYTLLDGGVYAVSPAMCALAEVLHEQPGSEVLMLSLGTGQLTRPLRFEKIRNWGELQWARPIFDVVLDGLTDVTDFQMRQLLPEHSYWRLQVELIGASDDLDLASEDNLRALRGLAERLVEERSAEIDSLCERLTSA